MPLSLISPLDANTKLSRDAVIVDIRAEDEYAREHIKGAVNIPVDQITASRLAFTQNKPVIFHCRSGMRTTMHAEKLAQATTTPAFILEGGIDNWKKAQLPVEKDTSRPIELQRQVQIGAGSLALLGCILGFALSPWFHLLSGFVGAGLLVAGTTGFCGMARVLLLMPWNKRT